MKQKHKSSLARLSAIAAISVSMSLGAEAGFAGSAPYATHIFEGTSTPSETTLTTTTSKIADGTEASARHSLSLNSTDIPYNHVTFQVPHNSYDYDPDDGGSGIIALLNAGYRAIEIDTHNRTGHGADFVSHSIHANRNHCGGGNTYLTRCLQDVADWLDGNNSWDGPITIWIDTKSASTDWTDGAHNATSGHIKSTLGDRVITPTEIKNWANAREETNDSLRVAVAAAGWPNIQDLGGGTDELGDIIVVLTGNTNSLDNYAANYSGTENDQMFLCPRVDDRNDFDPTKNPTGFNDTEAGWVVCGNFQWGDHRQEMMNESYDSNFLSHVWDGSGGYADLENFHHAYIANSHGAQFLARGHDGETFDNHIPLVSVRRSTPGYFTMKNNKSSNCMDIEGVRSSDGTKALLYDCGTEAEPKTNQNFAYTMEGQLRPRHATRKCVDVKGGNASGEWRNIHIWDCDGGSSEKWQLQHSTGSFVNREDTGYGIGTGGTNSGAVGTYLFTRNTANLAWAGQWKLIARDDWPDNVEW